MQRMTFRSSGRHNTLGVSANTHCLSSVMFRACSAIAARAFPPGMDIDLVTLSVLLTVVRFILASQSAT